MSVIVSTSTSVSPRSRSGLSSTGSETLRIRAARSGSGSESSSEWIAQCSRQAADESRRERKSVVIAALFGGVYVFVWWYVCFVLFLFVWWGVKVEVEVVG